MVRILGYFLGLIALAALAWDVWRGPFQEQPLEWTPTAEFWASFDRVSLIGLNSFVEKQISPDFWDSYVLPTLTLPAFVLAAILALICMLLARRGPTGRAGLPPKSRRGARR